MTTKIGDLGEQLVSQWLQSKSYSILHHSWHCRWGEVDIIAEDKTSSTLIFVEVKTRSISNWDTDGLEAISLSKQQKISRSAALFLAENSQYVDYYMRFDVALVNYKKQRKPKQLKISMDNYVPENSHNNQILPPQIITELKNGYILTIVNYLENAFEES
ncbi:conserved hypothetical protein [Hyella patelloides LEGE 07179]|uniref:UPF0102 protein H1P_330014 n=1 Tax=Hyella patelloides LEGE 07179 TaxID=945734 RepID=A0A563VVD2_9CYAN|nr:YraN family protein [Hyella patelloides]VEP15365.1 conserved hypothetical protein [Hyella patelloides LEGE 07179]